jgi:DNA-binding response OmpR family regulator
MMPKKDGFSVLQDLKDGANKVPVIVSSNLSQQDDFAKAKALGASDYFVKSDTTIAEVVERVKIALH